MQQISEQPPRQCRISCTTLPLAVTFLLIIRPALPSGSQPVQTDDTVKSSLRSSQSSWSNFFPIRLPFHMLQNDSTKSHILAAHNKMHLLQGRHMTLNVSVIIPCSKDSKCDEGYTWRECTSTSDGACIQCSPDLPANAKYTGNGCDFACQPGYFKHDSQCRKCLEQGQPQAFLECMPGFYKVCHDNGFAKCSTCTNKIPMFAVYSVQKASEYSELCPWVCLPGFWSDSKKLSCEPCTGSKPNNSHFVLGSPNQVAESSSFKIFINGKCPFQCDRGFQPSLSRCESDPAWRDVYGANCTIYNQQPEWCKNAESYAVGTGSAEHHCCICGGGSRLLECVACPSLPERAFWDGMLADHFSEALNSSRWILTSNCSWQCNETTVNFPGLRLYKAGSNCDRCDLEPCPSGFYRVPCFPGQGARCIECSNALPAAARYIGPGSPIHSDNCQWDCTGIYDRRGDVCIVGRIAVWTSVTAGSLLMVACGISAGYHSLRTREQSRATAALQDQEGSMHRERFARLTSNVLVTTTPASRSEIVLIDTLIDTQAILAAIGTHGRGPSVGDGDERRHEIRDWDHIPQPSVHNDSPSANSGDDRHNYSTV